MANKDRQISDKTAVLAFLIERMGIEVTREPEILRRNGIKEKHLTPEMIKEASKMQRDMKKALEVGIAEFNALAAKNQGAVPVVMPSAERQMKEPTAKVSAAKRLDSKAAKGHKATSKTKKVDKTATAKDNRKYDLLGYSVTSVLRRLGKEGMSYKGAKAVLEAYGLGDVSNNTVRIQVLAGTKGERGEPAPLTKAQLKELWSA